MWVPLAKHSCVVSFPDPHIADPHITDGLGVRLTILFKVCSPVGDYRSVTITILSVDFVTLIESTDRKASTHDQMFYISTIQKNLAHTTGPYGSDMLFLSPPILCALVELGGFVSV